jgi:protein-tyrosine phosphatase
MTHIDGATDLHSHLVPGVDDGARTLDESMEGIGRMVESGVERIVTTPHFDASLCRDEKRFAARIEEIDDGFARLRQAVAEAHPDVELGRGQEVLLDDPFPDLSDPRLRLDGTRFVLVEWPRLSIPPSTPEVIQRIRSDGWVPIIAHPERYRDILANFGIVSAWRRAGACLQMNHGSLVGRYGRGPQAAAMHLLEGGWVDLLSSDFHGRPHLSIFLAEIREWLTSRGHDEVFEILTRVNPGRVLGDELPEPVPSITIERSLWSRLTGFLRPGPA